MSHLKERREKNCLNCNAIIYGRYCHICGQENVEPKENVWHLINHFFQDITHFDGKFFSSLKLLVTRPGFLSKEYLRGRRASYLNPVRFYVFTSFVFFLIFFSIFRFQPRTTINIDTGTKKAAKDDLQKMGASEYKQFIDEVVKNDSSMMFAYDRDEYFKYLDSAAKTRTNKFRFTPNGFKNRQQYDSAIAAGKKDTWITRQLLYRQFELDEKYKGDLVAVFSALMDKLMHSIPQLLFISLPFFALFLKLLYIRRKDFYYVNHAVFTIHLFILVFIALLAVFGINKLSAAVHAGWLTIFSTFIVVGIFLYHYLAMKNFYRQGWGKTFLKFVLLHLANFIVVLVLFIGFIFLSFFKI